MSAETIRAEVARMRLQYGDDWLVTALVMTMTETARLKKKVADLEGRERV